MPTTLKVTNDQMDERTGGNMCREQSANGDIESDEIRLNWIEPTGQISTAALPAVFSISKLTQSDNCPIDLRADCT
jgi:hypothetical protein